jgi:hypothetical protein
MEACKRSSGAVPKPLGYPVATVLRHVVQVAALGVLAGFAELPTARADEPPVPPFRPAVSGEAATAISQMGKTLSAKELSFTAKIIRVYLDPSGQPLHIFHTMKVVARRPDRLALQVTGDDGSHDLFYDGQSVSIFSPDVKEYGAVAAPGDIPSALNEVTEKLNVDFPLAGFLEDSPDKAFLSGVVAGWRVGTASIDGVEYLHLFFVRRGGIDVELWAENNSEALPRRLIVTHRLLPGQPNFIAEFSDWNTQARPSDSVFEFEPPAGATRVELGPIPAPGQEGGR